MFLLFFALALILYSCTKEQILKNNREKPFNRILLDSAFKTIIEKDTFDFRKINSKGLELSKQQKDTFAIADAYWNLGSFHDIKEQWDSSYYYYYLSKKNFEAINNRKNAAKMLFNMAVVQNNVRDFTGSEINTFKAIGLFDEKEHHINLYRCYNLLGSLHYKLNEIDKSIESHKIAIDYLNEVKKKRTFLEGSYNNIGLTYQKAKQHKNAIQYFNKALNNDSLQWLNPSLYAKVIDNRAYNKFLLGDTLDIYNDFNKALSIRDSINYKSGIIVSKLHISEYLAYKYDTLSAFELTKQALKLAEEINNHRDRLYALQLLSNLEKEKASKYLQQYIQLDDSLKVEEKKIRNKFTRISYETDKFIEEVDRQKKEKILAYFLSAISLLLLGSLFYIRIQTSKTKRLTLESEQQKDREQIYQLMLKQEYVHQEAKKEERTRISEDLHDGVLGGLYGTRMNLGFLDLDSSEESKVKIDEYLNDIQKIEEEIRAISHALKSEIFNSQSNFISISQRYIESIKNTNLTVTFIDNSNLDWEQISHELKINYFRIIQEAYYNTVKYAEAKNFTVNFDFIEDKIKLIISDDGKGFDVNKKRKGIGIQNICNRVKKLGGKVEITSKLNKGTKIIVLFRNQNIVNEKD